MSRGLVDPDPAADFDGIGGVSWNDVVRLAYYRWDLISELETSTLLFLLPCSFDRRNFYAQSNGISSYPHDGAVQNRGTLFESSAGSTNCINPSRASCSHTIPITGSPCHYHPKH
jgi:hypothetical protein